MNDISFAWLFWKPQSSDRQGRTASLIFWMLYNDCSPLSQEVNLTHLRLLTDRNFSSFSPPTQACWLWDTLVILVWACHPCFHLVSGSHKMAGQGTAGTNPFSLGREKMTFSSDPKRGKKEDLPFGTRGRGRDDGNSGKQNDECKIHKRQDCSTATAYWGQWTTGRNWLYFRLWNQTCLTPLSVPAITVTFLCVCSQGWSRLFPSHCVWSL